MATDISHDPSSWVKPRGQTKTIGEYNPAAIKKEELLELPARPALFFWSYPTIYNYM